MLVEGRHPWRPLRVTSKTSWSNPQALRKATPLLIMAVPQPSHIYTRLTSSLALPTASHRTALASLSHEHTEKALIYKPGCGLWQLDLRLAAFRTMRISAFYTKPSRLWHSVMIARVN